MGFGMNADETQQDERFNKAIKEFGQGHLAQQDATKSEFQPLTQKSCNYDATNDVNVSTNELHSKQTTATNESNAIPTPDISTTAAKQP